MSLLFPVTVGRRNNSRGITRVDGQINFPSPIRIQSADPPRRSGNTITCPRASGFPVSVNVKIYVHSQDIIHMLATCGPVVTQRQYNFFSKGTTYCSGPNLEPRLGQYQFPINSLLFSALLVLLDVGMVSRYFDRSLLHKR